MKTAALFVVVALLGCGSDAAREQAPTTLAGDWMCYMPGHEGDPYAPDTGYASHLTASNVATDGQPSGTFLGAWTVLNTYGYVGGSWSGGTITLTPIDEYTRQPAGEAASGPYTPGARSFTVTRTSPGGFLGLWFTTEATVTCVKYAGQ